MKCCKQTLLMLIGLLLMACQSSAESEKIINPPKTIFKSRLPGQDNPVEVVPSSPPLPSAIISPLPPHPPVITPH